MIAIERDKLEGALTALCLIRMQLKAWEGGDKSIADIKKALSQPPKRLPVIYPAKRELPECENGAANSSYFRALGWNEAIDAIQSIAQFEQPEDAFAASPGIEQEPVQFVRNPYCYTIEQKNGLSQGAMCRTIEECEQHPLYDKELDHIIPLFK